MLLAKILAVASVGVVARHVCRVCWRLQLPLEKGPAKRVPRVCETSILGPIAIRAQFGENLWL